jgi:hypothetical protein
MKREGRGLNRRTLEMIRLMAVERVRDGAGLFGYLFIRVQPDNDL